jgi:hypothetical protein
MHTECAPADPMAMFKSPREAHSETPGVCAGQPRSPIDCEIPEGEIPEVRYIAVLFLPHDFQIARQY